MTIHNSANATVRMTRGRWGLMFPTVFDRDDQIVQRHFTLDDAIRQADAL
jgi:hypothetical protein